MVETWKISFMFFIVVGFNAAIAMGQGAFLILPIIMIIVLAIAAVRCKPKPIRQSTKQQSQLTTRTYNSWESKKGGGSKTLHYNLKIL